MARQQHRIARPVGRVNGRHASRYGAVLIRQRKAMLAQLAPRLCLASASACTEAPMAALLQPSRGPRAVAEARRFGMAMLVLGFGYSLSRAGHVARRDRTTARHACEMFVASERSQGHRAGFLRLDPAMKLWIEAMLEAGLPDPEPALEAQVS